MEHSLGSTLVREEEVVTGLKTHIEWRSAQERPDGSQVTPRHKRSLRRRVLNEGFFVFLLSFTIYFIVAWLLDLKYRSFSPDAVSRMANGFYILYSRDPHLAAVGFVWEPLQSIADAVFLIGNHLWPALSHNDMAGSLVSVFAMAGAVYQICASLREWGVSRVPRLVLTAFFALDPMIVLYGGNGMSEGLYVFTLVAATRYLLRWVRSRDLRSLAYAAVALAFSYLTRNEAVGAVLLGAAAVAAISFSRADGLRLSRVKTALADAAIFGVPSFVAAAGWAITSYVITGEPFEQFSSIYGTSTQQSLLQTKIESLHGRELFEFHAIGALAPFLPFVLIVAALVALKHRDPRILAPIGVLGGALGFDVLAYLNNSIQQFIRYFIAVLPLEVLLVGSLIAAIQAMRPARSEVLGAERPRRSGIHFLGGLASVCLVLGVMIPTSVTTGAAMFNPKLGILEINQLGFIFHTHPSPSDISDKDNYGWVLTMGDWFTSRRLPEGDVVVDNFPECVPPLLTTISQPKIFVIPNDQDYERTLADPISFHARYILEADPLSFPNTSINIKYPNLWKTGAGFTKLVHEFPSRADCPAFRLFRVVGHSNEVA
jgi:hypothetical protein